MDFLDPKKRRSYNIRLFIGFVLISIAIVLATTVLALITAGYTINRKTGQVIQDGLVFINSQPVSAAIYINGALAGNTNARYDLGAGNYSIRLQHNGYHIWSNKITLYGGQVEQLNYPFLFPSSPLKSTISNISLKPEIASSTPDRHWMLVSVPGQVGSFYMIDITNTKIPITTITIPSSVLANQPGTNVLTAVEWSNDNQHLVLKDNYTGGSQFIMLDRTNPANSFNINKLFNTTSFTNIKLDNQSYNKLYLFDQTTGGLSLGDVGAKTSTNVLNGVLAYWPYGSNQIVYTTAETKSTSQVDANLWNTNGQIYTLRQLPIGTSYQLNMASYNGNLYVVVGSSASVFAYIYLNPLNDLTAHPNQQPLPFTLLVVKGAPENVTFSNSARFIALQSGSQFAIYDIQYDTHYRYDTGLSFGTAQLAYWMDGNRLDAIIGGKLMIWDFDGTNIVPFVDGDSTYLPAFNQAYSAVYTLNPLTSSNTNQWQVTRNSLVADKQ